MSWDPDGVVLQLFAVVEPGSHARHDAAGAGATAVVPEAVLPRPVRLDDLLAAQLDLPDLVVQRLDLVLERVQWRR